MKFIWVWKPRDSLTKYSSAASVVENEDKTMSKEQFQAPSSDEKSWKRFQQDIDKQMRLETLHEAIASRDMYSLYRAIHRCEKIENLSEKESNELRKAQFFLTVENYRQRLMHAMGEDYPVIKFYMRWRADRDRLRDFQSLIKSTMDKDYETLNRWIDICEKHNIKEEYFYGLNYQEKIDLKIAKEVLDECNTEGAEQNKSEQDSACTMDESSSNLSETVNQYNYHTSKPQTNYKELISTIREIKNHENKNIRAALQQDIIIAESKAEKLKKKNKHTKVLRMDRKTITELARYSNPPRIIQRLMQAVFLLLGEDIYYLQVWGYCLNLLNRLGICGLRKKMTELDTDSISTEIYSSAKFLLQVFDDSDGFFRNRLITLPEVQKVSLAAASFYAWAKGVIEEWEKIHGVQAVEEYVPDHIKAMKSSYDQTTYYIGY